MAASQGIIRATLMQKAPESSEDTDGVLVSAAELDVLKEITTSFEAFFPEGSDSSSWHRARMLYKNLLPILLVSFARCPVESEGSFGPEHINRPKTNRPILSKTEFCMCECNEILRDPAKYVSQKMDDFS